MELTMMATSILGSQIDILPIRRVSVDAPSHWLVSAWHDFRRAPLLALGYGALFVIAGYLIVYGLYSLDLASLVPTAIGGFFLVAPILAVGLYEISRGFEIGQPASLSRSLAALKRNPGSLSAIGLVLILCLAAWFQIALLIFMLFFHQSPPSLDHFFGDILTSADAVPFLLFGTAVGYVIASAVFAISAISIPILLEHRVPAFVAIATSVAAVRENWLVMLGWAATIVVLVGVGIATFFVGLAVTLPLCAFATWHCYRALVE
jgi:uncharacterized membrane protein